MGCGLARLLLSLFDLRVILLRDGGMRISTRSVGGEWRNTSRPGIAAGLRRVCLAHRFAPSWWLQRAKQRYLEAFLLPAVTPPHQRYRHRGPSLRMGWSRPLGRWRITAESRRPHPDRGAAGTCLTASVSKLTQPAME